MNRSNSLSINTGATNSLFSQQTSNAGTTGGLFGTANTQNTTQPSGGLFGNTNNQNTTQTSGGLFGSNTNTTQTQPSGGLFGNSTQQSQPQQTGGLFGSTNTQPQNTSNTGGLFGGGNMQNQNASNTGGGGLFGNLNNQNNTQSTGGLFGSANTNNNQQGGGIKLGTNSLFGGQGGLGASVNLGSGPNMFAQPSNNQSTFGGGSTFRQPAQPAAPSLLGATQHAQMNNSAPFGRLSMGQTTAGGAQPTVGAVKINYDSMRPTTRFEDLEDSVKNELEQIDKLIQQQESFARQIEAFLPRHEENVKSVAPDVDYVKNKVDDVEQALAFDAQGVENQRKNADKDRKDFERLHRAITNLTLPQSYQFPNLSMNGYGYGQQRPQQPPTSVEGEDSSNSETDIIGNYFAPMATDLQNMMNAYTSNLAEIESHMRVIESSAVAQQQQLALRQAGIGGNTQNSNDTVRELADTLRGFEQSILGVAGVVGECREGVNQLILGRLGNSLNGVR